MTLECYLCVASHFRSPHFTGQALVSLTKLYSASTTFNNEPSSIPAAGNVGSDSTAPLLGKIATGLRNPSTEALLRQEVAILEKQREALDLASEELKLIHERSARRNAIDIAQSMISTQETQHSKFPNAPVAATKPAPYNAQLWCARAAAQFGIYEPISISQRWGSMQDPAYQDAWTAHSCDAKAFGHPIPANSYSTNTLKSAPIVESKSIPIISKPAVPTLQTNAQPSTAVAFSYLRDDKTAAGSRRTITVLVWNKIRGFLDWLRPDFKKDAREKCSTECIFTDDKRELQKAHGVLFHAKTHSMSDFPRSKSNPKQKYMMVSLEQPSYAPLMKQKSYLDKFDYILTYDLDSTVPIITIHPHYSAIEYVYTSHSTHQTLPIFTIASSLQHIIISPPARHAFLQVLQCASGPVS